MRKSQNNKIWTYIISDAYVMCTCKEQYQWVCRYKNCDWKYGSLKIYHSLYYYEQQRTNEILFYSKSAIY